MVEEFTDESFDRELQGSDTPILVDFWAPWCGPCKLMGPVVEQIAEEYRGRLRVGKLNVDENPRTAARYGIMSIPNLILFKDGKPVGQLVGARPVEQLRRFLEEHLGS